jgi:hypothetical protein
MINISWIILKYINHSTAYKGIKNNESNTGNINVIIFVNVKKMHSKTSRPLKMYPVFNNRQNYRSNYT